ncbi:unnamed protein product [Spirodela intermedia]|uniref:Uncharacterized protein n=1 Tax=Spirodela intermedia TaxID=51605 RepID=A0A7I8IQ41_SPIIN|nr:unnamed protein product [Spirodela intermedia]CAA6659695.1 unnamed protein product [Spirodela intermedia]
MAATTAAVVAVAVVVLAMVAAGALGEIVAPRNYSISSPPVYNWTALPDPLNRPYYMPEPAVRDMRNFLVNGTVPSSNTCDGVNRLHPHCWPDMFNIFWEVTPRRIHRLRKFCLQNGTLPPPTTSTSPKRENTRDSATSSVVRCDFPIIN